MKRIGRKLGTVAAVLVVAAGGAWGLSPRGKCESSKLKVAAKYGFCRLKAESTGLRKGEPPDFTKCDEKYSSKWQRAETKAGSGVCPSEGDEIAIQAFVAQHTDDVATALAGGTQANCPGDLSACQNDLAAAQLCGNAVVDGGEDCDQGNLDGETCVSLAFAGGRLACGAGCAFDTSGCYAARFVDNADGTITDNETGLTWEKKVAVGGGPSVGNPHDADNSYVWAGTCSIQTDKLCQPTAAAAALCAANSEGGTAGCDQCAGGDGTCSATSTAWTLAVDLNSASFAGQTDWRVPNREELVSIVDYFDTTLSPVTDITFHGASCGVACTDITSAACSCTQPSYYWSASSLAPDPGLVWSAIFSNGLVFGVDKLDFHYVRAVRGES